MLTFFGKFGLLRGVKRRSDETAVVKEIGYYSKIQNGNAMIPGTRYQAKNAEGGQATPKKANKFC